MRKTSPKSRFVLYSILLLIGVFFFSAAKNDSCRQEFEPAYGETYTDYQQATRGDITFSHSSQKNSVFKIKIKRYKKRYFLGARSHEKQFLKEQEQTSSWPLTFFDKEDAKVFSHVSYFFLCKPSYYVFLHLYALF